MCQCKTMLNLKKKKKDNCQLKRYMEDMYHSRRKKKKTSSQIQERRIIAEKQLGNSLIKKIKAPIVNSLFME